MIRTKLRYAVAGLVAFVMGFPLTERVLARGLEVFLDYGNLPIDLGHEMAKSSSDC